MSDTTSVAADVDRTAAGLEDLARTERTIGFRVKELLLSERELRRQLEAWSAALAVGDPHHADVETTPAWNLLDADVTVVVPLFNHAPVVGEAIASALASAELAVEVVVVDDHSTDASVEVVRACMADQPWAPVALVRRAANGGPAAARNTGFALARAPVVFPLDADDLLYPTGLTKLAAALEGSDASFAYGIVERPGPDPALMSWLPWDVARLCQDNYITVMALIRRSAWEALGGYDPGMNTNFGGWEDYELWLHMAAQGHTGLLVPEIIGRYRQGGWSTNSLMNLDVSLPLVHLRRRYPKLPWPDLPWLEP